MHKAIEMMVEERTQSSIDVLSNDICALLKVPIHFRPQYIIILSKIWTRVKSLYFPCARVEFFFPQLNYLESFILNIVLIINIKWDLYMKLMKLLYS